MTHSKVERIYRSSTYLLVHNKVHLKKKRNIRSVLVRHLVLINGYEGQWDSQGRSTPSNLQWSKMCQTSHQKRVPYFDDCTIFLKRDTTWEHLSRLQGIFQRFRDTSLKVNPAKSDDSQTKLQILGHIVRAKTTYKATPQKSRLFGGFPCQRTKLK